MIIIIPPIGPFSGISAISDIGVVRESGISIERVLTIVDIADSNMIDKRDQSRLDVQMEESILDSI